MGCDGGTIPKRDELVKTKKKPEQKDKTSEQSFRWKNCALSQEMLQEPIVACEMGRIYNKDSVIESLLDKSSEIKIPHVKSLKDVKVLNLSKNNDWTNGSEAGDGYIDSNKAQWICPISGQEMNGNFRFVFLWKCGCVFSEKALKECTVHECLKCQKPFELLDVIQLNPVDEEETYALITKMETRRNKAKELKKSKKSKAETHIQTSSTPTLSTSTSSKDLKDDTSKAKIIPNGSKDNKTIKNGNSSSSSNSKRVNGAPLPTEAKKGKLSTNYSVAKDPNASDTYKSLFTSSETASSQQRAHWVTYNPFYN